MTRLGWKTALLVGALHGACGEGGLGGPPTDPANPDPVCTGSLCDRAQLDRLGLHPFYQKYLDADGIPVISSHRTRDDALVAAREIVIEMLAGRPDLRDAMIANSARVGIMAQSEVTTDIPEHAFLRNDPNVDWDTRARGLGGTPGIPITTGAEENLLCLAGDVYAGESILVHEFAHGIHLLGINFVDVGFPNELRALYDAALVQGLWAGTYAATNEIEYWAEGVQSYFDTNQRPQPGIHNEIDTRAELLDYDPALHDLIGVYYPDSPWRPSCPAATQ